MRIALVGLVGLTTFSSSVAHAQMLGDEPVATDTTRDIHARLERMVILLDDPSWNVRQQAMRMIGDPNEGFELDMLAPLLERGDLSNEARLRLMQATRLLFAKSTKAGLGVGFGAVRDGGVEIGTVVRDVDQFPAAGMLKPGDLIIGAEGKPLTTSEDLRATILSHEPGETLNLLIQRTVDGDENTQVMDMDLPLGSYRLLTGAAPINARIADRAIQLRWDRQGITLPGPEQIGTGIDVDDWVAAGYPEEPGDFRPSNLRRAPRMVSSGSARDVFVGVGTVARGRIEPWTNRSNAQIAMDQARRIELSQQLNVARMQVQLFTNAIKMLDQQIKDGDADPATRTKLSRAQQQLRDAQAELDQLTDEFERIPSAP
ncbi:MAG: PDZ domain-containing protein [Phycisphaerales bacterium]|nr:PDZ domain-containing protein [Phycisphaerales bacterium]